MIAQSRGIEGKREWIEADRAHYSAVMSLSKMFEFGAQLRNARGEAKPHQKACISMRDLASKVDRSRCCFRERCT